MREIFADSNYWIALLNPKDALHVAARDYECPHRLVTTLAVQLEVMDAFSSPPFRQLASLFWEMTTNSADVVVMELSPDLMKSAVELFGQRQDKSWTFTDCISFVLMTERNISEALTSDHHFEQAGFSTLLLGRR